MKLHTVDLISCLSTLFSDLEGCFTRNGDFTWRVSDCEELVGEVNHTTECVTDFLVLLMLNGQFCDPIQTIWVGKGYSLKVTPMRVVELTGVTAVKDEPLSVDLTMFPETPSATKILFTNPIS